MLRRLLGEREIPARYEPLIERFWPGPLTILLPLPDPSPLAPEVTAGLATFGVRMPSSPLALTLVKLAGAPLAAPSANASTKPSPTTAQHVRDDLDGRIELILDGGPCQVGVESTVVDGLCDPPAVLRPGGIGIEELRACPGWASVVRAYKDWSEEGKAAPRAPGMKYKHYSPRARVVLYEASNRSAASGPLPSDVQAALATISNGDSSHAVSRTIGIIRTKRWKLGAGLDLGILRPAPASCEIGGEADQQQSDSPYQVFVTDLETESGTPVGQVYDLGLGTDTRGIAQGLFAALRELDRRGTDTIFVDGIEGELDVAAAVMNRLRKAASEIRA
ncbi:telomere recombination domain-containing protein [Hirsutella rhossiliensis]|uniref:Threonylcarbamoyl-AMP synthase n=1 Tax=Hirsutella rhossiliensis TaxID=111463 RepID=A0A9P8N2D9_9HYPO|nr:telomere recombination domain-containing protein [Hirsutella rhossiliensis]KAH0963462.1 telomere recombination domain-containing protein [Hirsutella rhossiliensis]